MTTIAAAARSRRTTASSDPHRMPPRDLKELRALPGNKKCVDCPAVNPEWASVTLGILVCLECAGHHRSLGTHVSFIRSVTMDAWTKDQLRRMQVAGGNDACQEFLCHHGSTPQLWVVPSTEKKSNNSSCSCSSSKTRRQVIQQKYDSPQGHFYQQVLTARLEGIPEPTQMPPLVPTTTPPTNSKYTAIRGGGKNTKKTQPRKMEGFGSSPHPSEFKKSRRRRASKKKTILGVAGAAALLGGIVVALKKKSPGPSSPAS